MRLLSPSNAIVVQSCGQLISWEQSRKRSESTENVDVHTIFVLDRNIFSRFPCESSFLEYNSDNGIFLRLTLSVMREFNENGPCFELDALMCWTFS